MLWDHLDKLPQVYLKAEIHVQEKKKNINQNQNHSLLHNTS